MQTRLSLQLSDSERMELGKAIKAARRAKKMSQEALGEKFGISKQAVTQWEKGKNMPDPRKLPELFRILDLDPAVAIGDRQISENAQLQTERGHGIVTTASDVRREEQAPPPPDKAGMRRIIPILGVVAVGGEPDFTMNAGSPIAFALETPGIEGRKDVFALYVQNDAMSPWREPGQLVYVDNHKPAQVTDYVVVEMKPERGSEDRPCYLRRLTARSGHTLRLEQYKPAKFSSVDDRKVHKIYRVIDWSELLD